VGEVGYAASVNSGDCAEVEELHQEPEANQKRGGYESDSHKNDEENDSADAVARISDEERAHYSSDCSARSKARDARERITEDLAHHCDYPAGEIEEDKPAGSHGVFDLAAEGPQINHVADDVHPAGMHEH